MLAKVLLSLLVQGPPKMCTLYWLTLLGDESRMRTPVTMMIYYSIFSENWPTIAGWRCEQKVFEVVPRATLRHSHLELPEPDETFLLFIVQLYM